MNYQESLGSGDEPDDHAIGRSRGGLTPETHALVDGPGRPVGFDAEDYKNRYVVERAFNKLKNWRELATRYDKHALTYRG